MNRRGFFVLIGGAAFASVVPNLRAAHTVEWESIIRSGLPFDDRAIREVGSRCPAAQDGATLPGVLGRLPLHPGVTWVATGARSSLRREEVIERLGQVIAGEYATGRTVLGDGWFLSETEAVLCAAACLRDREAQA